MLKISEILQNCFESFCSTSNIVKLSNISKDLKLDFLSNGMPLMQHRRCISRPRLCSKAERLFHLIHSRFYFRNHLFRQSRSARFARDLDIKSL